MLSSRNLLRYTVSSMLVILWPLHVLAAEDTVSLRNIPLPPPEKRYPVKNDPNSIRSAYSQSAQWEGRAVAVEGAVKSIETDDRGHPSIEVILGRVGDTTIW